MYFGIVGFGLQITVNGFAVNPHKLISTCAVSSGQL